MTPSPTPQPLSEAEELKQAANIAELRKELANGGLSNEAALILLLELERLRQQVATLTAAAEQVLIAEQDLTDLVNLASSEARHWQRADKKTAEHWEHVAQRVRSAAIVVGAVSDLRQQLSDAKSEKQKLSDWVIQLQTNNLNYLRETLGPLEDKLARVAALPEQLEQEASDIECDGSSLNVTARVLTLRGIAERISAALADAATTPETEKETK